MAPAPAQGSVWRNIFTEAREETGISPVETKDDLYRIMSHAVRKVNSEPRIKEVLLTFLKPYAFERYKAASSYKWAAIVPSTFIQWLAVIRNKTITVNDLEPPNLLPDDASVFASEYSTSDTVQAHVRAILSVFGKYLVSRYVISKQPFVDLKVDMPRVLRVIVYNDEKLDEFYNTIMFGAKEHYLLFWKLLLQTGMRPLHTYILQLGDIRDKPETDALGRKFYPIAALDALTREKRKIKETVFKKTPSEFHYISEGLYGELQKYAKDHGITPGSYLFKDSFELGAINEFIRRRREGVFVTKHLKFPDENYILYGLRHTWSSVLYSITNDIGVLMDYGGWGGQGIPLKHYRHALEPDQALNLARKWGIYIPAEKKLAVQAIESMQPKEVPDTAGITKGELDKIWEYMEKQDKRIAELTKKLEEKKG